MKNTIIFDLDGTLCDVSHRLPLIQGKKRDYDAFHAACVNDVPKHNIIHLLRTLALTGSYHIIICSGRSNIVETETRDWLRKNVVLYDKLIMREHGDHTHDDVLKRKWLNDGLLGEKDDILFVFEDRCRVVDMWRSEGLTCLQVDKWETK
jgi:hypothetical protein